MDSKLRSLPHFHQAALASAFTFSIVSPMATWAAQCETPVANPLVVNIATESEDACDDQVSLREAIAYANDTLGKDTVTFAEALNGQTIQPTNGRIWITESVAITGRTEPQLTKLKASNTSSLFQIESTSDRIDFDLSNTVLEKAGGSNYLIEMDGYGGDINLDNIQTTNATQAYGLFQGTTYQSDTNDLNLTLKNSSISGSTFDRDAIDSYSGWNSHDNSSTDLFHNILIENTLITGTSGGSLVFAGGKGTKGRANITLKSSVIDNQSNFNFLLDSYVSRGSSTININDSKIQNSGAQVLAYSYSSFESNINIENSTITDNEVYSLVKNYSYGDNPGAITIKNSNLDANTILDVGIDSTGKGLINIDDAILCDNITGYGGDVPGDYPLVNINAYTELNITDSSICNNQLSAIKLSVHSDGTATANIQQSRLSNNKSKYGGAAVSIEAIDSARIDVNINNSTIDENASLYSGGAIQAFSRNDAIINLGIHNSTLSKNRSITYQDFGGAVFGRANDTASLNIDVTHTTITENESGTAGGGINIPFPTNNIVVNIENSIVANNTAAYGSDHDLLGEFNVENSLIKDTSTSYETTHINGTLIDQIGNGEGLTPDSGNNLLGVDPLLQDLALSGSSWVHQLTAESPAINTGNASAANLPEFDQRGDGFARVRNANGTPELDMGAVQFFANPVAVNDSVSVTQNSSSNVLSVLNNDAVSSNGLVLDAGSITIMSHPENGAAEAQQDGTVLYTPNAGYLGDDTFTYVVQDIGGNTSTEATVTINVAKTSSGGGSMNFWLLSLLGLFGLNRRK